MASHVPEAAGPPIRQCVGAVSDRAYQQWAEEVLALPIRKRKNWTGWTLDTQGCRNLVRYAPQDVGLGVQTLFEGRTTAQMAGVLSVPVGAWLPLESQSIIAEKAARHQARNEVRVLQNPATRELVGPIIGEQEFNEMAHALVAENHTGRHRPHVHAVRIPTAAGQPVRG
jgi:hypothetical protein